MTFTRPPTLLELSKYICDAHKGNDLTQDDTRPVLKKIDRRLIKRLTCLGGGAVNPLYNYCKIDTKNLC